ncbi:MAG: HD domain-containing protein [Desulfatibacillaceae bacterium]
MQEARIPILSRWLSGFLDHAPPVYLVGGTVRDLLLGRRPADVDLACKNARELATSLARERKAAFVPMEKDPSAPSFRLVNRDDPDDFLDVTELRAGDIQADLAERDFTINAMAIRLRPEDPGLCGDLVDPLGGRDDLARRLVRPVGENNLRDDPLRILRGFRFAAQLDFSLAEGSLDIFARYRDLLRGISGERVQKELLDLLETDLAGEQVRGMEQCGVLDVVFPEVSSMRGCAQDGFHHLDVWEHSLVVFGACEKIAARPETEFPSHGGQVRGYLSRGRNKAVLKMAALLHDAGKPDTRRFREEKNRYTFYGHARAGARKADETGRRLRMSNRDRGLLTLLVAEHVHVMDLAAPKVKDSTRMSWFRKMGEHAVAGLILGLADTRGKKGPAVTGQDRECRESFCKKMVAEYYDRIRDTLAEKPLVTGSDLLDMGLDPGPEVGRILDELRKARDDGTVSTREEAMDMARRMMEGEGS